MSKRTMTKNLSPGLELMLDRLAQPAPVHQSVDVKDLVIASWTGRNRAATESRIAELESLGIPRPPKVPMLYRVASTRASTSNVIEVLGERTSGEVEFVLLSVGNDLWVGVGSDHTDREAEASNAALSKQLCEKPISMKFWAFEDVHSHWDSLHLRSYITEADGTRSLYQQGSVTSMLPPSDLVKLRDSALKRESSGARLMFCGTLPTVGPIRHASRFEIELEDTFLDRRLSHVYDIKVLPAHL